MPEFVKDNLYKKEKPSIDYLTGFVDGVLEGSNWQISPKPNLYETYELPYSSIKEIIEKLLKKEIKLERSHFVGNQYTIKVKLETKWEVFKILKKIHIIET